MADGGGGSAGVTPNAGPGGVDSDTGPGQSGGDAVASGWAGGGGGAGASGGAGGDGATGGGAAGGTNPGDPGADAAGGIGGRGGGGGGAHGYVGGTGALPSVDTVGGEGGNGGNADISQADGGGGGAGGYGAVITGSGTLGSLDIQLKGGAGGDGGDAGFSTNYYAGNGGSGGIGLRFSDPGAKTIAIGADVAGGNGGDTGTAAIYSNAKGEGGAGGAGISGDDLTVEILPGISVTGGDGGDRDPNDATGDPNFGTGGAGIVGSDLAVVAAGTITGGMNGNAAGQSDAITFTGGSNRLELHDGYGFSGDVDASAGASSALALGGATDSAFDLANVGANLQFQGFTAFEKVGASRWTLTGTTTETAAWQVNGGTLSVNGSIASSTGVTVNGGGTLGGTGTTAATMVQSGGTLAPGNSIGTITVMDSLTFAPGSTYEVEVSPTSADRTNVVAGAVGTGDADLSGAMVLALYDPGSYVDNRYVIVDAEGGLGGTRFTGLSGNAPFGIDQSLAYDADTAYLVIDNIYSEALGLTANQNAVADTVNEYFNATGGIPGAFVGLLPDELSGLTGEVATAAMSAGLQQSKLFLGLIGDPSGPGASGGAREGTGGADLLGYAPAETATAQTLSPAQAPATPWQVWASVYGGDESIGGDPAGVGSADLSTSTWGLASGFTRSFGRNSVGIALGGAESSYSLAGGLGSGDTTSFNAGIHGTAWMGQGYLAGALAYGYHETRTERVGGGDSLSGRFGAQTFGGRIEGGYQMPLGDLAFTPYAAAEATAYRLPAHTENSTGGGSFALAYSAQTETAVRTELGARMALDVGDNVKLTGRAAWVWNAERARAVTAAFQALPGTSFTTDGAAPARHAALLEAGLEAGFGSSVTASFTVAGEFSSNVNSLGAAAKLGFTW